MAYAITESTEETERTEFRPQTGLFCPPKAQKNRISAVYFIHCYSNCYSILKTKRLSRFIASLSYNNPHSFYILLRGERPFTLA